MGCVIKTAGLVDADTTVCCCFWLCRHSELRKRQDSPQHIYILLPGFEADDQQKWHETSNVV